MHDGTIIDEEETLTKRDRCIFAWAQVRQIVGKVWPYVLIGVGIGALIHNWIPAEIIGVILGNKNPFSVLIATLLGAPVYADIFGTLPIAEAPRRERSECGNRRRLHDVGHRTLGSVTGDAQARGKFPNSWQYSSRW